MSKTVDIHLYNSVLRQLAELRSLYKINIVQTMEAVRALEDNNLVLALDILKGKKIITTKMLEKESNDVVKSITGVSN